VFGGEHGACGRFVHVSADGVEHALANKPSGIRVRAGEQLVVQTPGAGGFGPPADRAGEAIEQDRRSGKFSDAFLARHYAR
jgi:N-methylhydantoinase B